MDKREIDVTRGHVQMTTRLPVVQWAIHMTNYYSVNLRVWCSLMQVDIY